MDIQQAKAEVIQLYNDLAPIVQEIVDKYAEPLNKLIKKLASAKTLTNDELREIILALSVESYVFSMAKEQSALRQECAETLMKEKIAQEYNAAEGTQNARNNISIINTVDKQVVNLLYEAVADMMKTKLDEAHRMISTLNSILISRNAEAKLTAVRSSSEPEVTHTRLLEDDNVF